MHSTSRRGIPATEVKPATSPAIKQQTKTDAINHRIRSFYIKNDLSQRLVTVVEEVIGRSHELEDLRLVVKAVNTLAWRNSSLFCFLVLKNN